MFRADAVRVAEEHADGNQDPTVVGETRWYEFFIMFLPAVRLC